MFNEEADTCSLIYKMKLDGCCVKVHGSSELVKSDWLEVQSTVYAEPPEISVTVLGLDERRQLERNICDLVNKRDRYVDFEKLPIICSLQLSYSQ